MATVLVTIDGKSYRMACGDGQEAHLERLAATLHDKVQDMRTAFGEIGDMRLTVMAAITIADELSEMQARVDEIEASVQRLQQRLDRDSAARVQDESRAADAIYQIVQRVETMVITASGAETIRNR